MNKVDPHVVTVKVHAASAHMKSIVGALGPAGVLVSHPLIPNYANSPKTQLLLQSLPMSILWHEVRACQADPFVRASRIGVTSHKLFLHENTFASRIPGSSEGKNLGGFDWREIRKECEAPYFTPQSGDIPAERWHIHSRPSRRKRDYCRGKNEDIKGFS